MAVVPAVRLKAGSAPPAVDLQELRRWADTYLAWGFRPLPLRHYRKFPWADIPVDRAAEYVGRVDDGTTGLWLWLCEPPHGDGSDTFHVALDVDDPGAVVDSARWDELLRSTFSYRTRRGYHVHLLVRLSRRDITIPRFAEFSVGGKHVFDLFWFAPAEHPQFTGSVNRGLCAYPSVVRNEDGTFSRRELVCDKPPMVLDFDEFIGLLKSIFGDGLRLVGAANRTGRSGRRVAGERTAMMLARLRSFPCLRPYVPSPDGAVERRVPEGARNNTLFRLVAYLANCAADFPVSEDALLEFAHYWNACVADPPLPEREVESIVRSALKGGYTPRIRNIAELLGSTDACVSCPHRAICSGDRLGTDVSFSEIPAPPDFPFERFRGEAQKRFYEDLVAKAAEHKFTLGLAETGAGKSAMVLGLAKHMLGMGSPVLVLAPQNALQRQYCRYGSEHRRPDIVLSLGKRHFPCPLVRDLEGAPLSADDAPCGVSARAVRVYIQLMRDCDRDAAQRILSEYCNASTCPYLQHREAVRRAFREASAVVVGNHGLVHEIYELNTVVRLRREQNATLQLYGYVIIDEAHEIVPALVSEFPLLYVDAEEAAVRGAAYAIARDLLLASSRYQELAEEYMSKIRQKRRASAAEILKLRNALTRLKNYIRKRALFADIMYAFPEEDRPKLFVVRVKNGRAYVYPNRRRIAEILRLFLERRFPNLRFVFLTATGESLQGAFREEEVVRMPPVIPPENKPVYYVKLWRGSVSKYRGRPEQYEVEIASRVAPYIVECYRVWARGIRDLFGVPHVKAIVHENQRHRALLYAKHIARHAPDLPVFVYAAGEPPSEDMPPNVRVFGKIDDAVAAFRQHDGDALLVAVALGTGHDFPEREVAIQFIPKIPFPEVEDDVYAVIELAEGKDARYQQYFADALDQLIQWLGRINRSPEKFGVTFILDAALDVFPRVVAKFPELEGRVRTVFERIGNNIYEV